MDPNRAARDGVFYVLQLVPDLRPERIKFGWTQNIVKRLRPYRYAAPTYVLMRTWACTCAWEYRAIAALTTNADTRLGREAFDVVSVDALLTRGDAFFAEYQRACPVPNGATSPLRVGVRAPAVVPMVDMDVARVRVLRGFSLRALGERVGLAANTIWRIETGRQRPRPSTRLALATALGYDVTDVEELANGGKRDPHQHHSNSTSQV